MNNSHYKKNQKLHIGILMGGRSIESEVSFNSGRTICDHIDTTRFEAIPLFQTRLGKLYILPWHFLHRGKTTDFLHRLDQEAEQITWDTLPNFIDFAFIVQHGRYAEDGILQGTLEVLNIPYLGSKIFASALGMNKAVHKKILHHHGIHVPCGIEIPKHLTISQDTISQLLHEHKLHFPLIVKPGHEGSSYGVSIVHALHEATDALLTARHIDPNNPQSVIIETFEHGREFSCIAIEEEGAWNALSVTEIIHTEKTKLYDYEKKYMPGRAHKQTPAHFDATIFTQITNTCIQVAQILNFKSIARIDGIYTPDGRIVIIDPNSLSGMAPNTFTFDQAALHGLSHKALITRLIENELKIDPLLYAQLSQTEEHHMQHAERKKVAVLFGGNSNEKEVSFDSGRNVFYKIPQDTYEPLPLFVNHQLKLFKIPHHLIIKNKTEEVESALDPSMEVAWSNLPKLVDFVFLGLHGGAGENGAVQGFLEMLNIPYNGSGVLTSSLCMNKAKTNEWLSMHGIATPDRLLFDLTSWNATSYENKKKIITQQINHLSFPLIVKPPNDGCSVLVSQVRTIEELIEALDHHASLNKPDVLCEEMIHGMELTVGAIGNEHVTVLPPSQAVTHHAILSMEEKFLPGAGENQTPAPLNAQAEALVKETIKKTYETVGCKGYARIDCFYQTAEESPTNEPRVVIIEVNTLPALTPATCLFHQAAEVGIRPSELIHTIIQLGFENHVEKCILNRNKTVSHNTF